MREEHAPIRAYLRRKGIPLDGVIELGGEAQDFDAKLSFKIGEQHIECTLEIVQALAKGAHKIRLAIANGRMNPETWEEEIRQINTFPQPIINAIRAKQDKRYADTRVLLVSVLGEVTCENDAIIERWLREVRSKTVLGSFSEIYLVEIARSRIFQIH